MKLEELSDLQLAFQIQKHRDQIDGFAQALNMLLAELNKRLMKEEKQDVKAPMVENL